MRLLRLVPILLTLLLGTCPAYAQLMATGVGGGDSGAPGCGSLPYSIAPTNSGATNSGTAASNVTTLPVPAGHTVVVAVDTGTANAAFSPTITDNAPTPNTYTVVQPAAVAGVFQAALAYKVGVAAMPVGTSFTATVGAPATNYNLKGAWDACAGAFDQSATLNQSTAGTSMTLTSGPLPGPNETAFGFTFVGTSTVITPDPGFASPSLLNTGFVDIAYRKPAGVSGATVSYHTTFGSNVSSGVLLAFQPGGASLAISGPGSGTMETASTAFTVTLTGTTFSGTQTVTITDGGNGGTFVPSIGTCATPGTCTVTPGVAATSFTFTYNQPLAIPVNLTVTNAQAWNNPSPAAYTTVCSQYSGSGGLASRLDNGQNASAVATLLCGLVKDGTYSLLDGFYVFATNSGGVGGNATKNWVQNNYNLVQVGTVTFHLNSDYQGDGSSGYFTTGFNPSTAGGQYLAASASVGVCVLNSRAAGNTSLVFGGAGSTGGGLYMQPLLTSTQFAYGLNSAAGQTPANSQAQGHWTISRTSSSSSTLYKNGSSFSVQSSDGSSARPAVAMYLGAYNNNGTAADFFSDKYAAVYFGAGFTSGQVSNIYNRLRAYLIAVAGSAGAC